MCLSPNSACAALAFRREGRLELQIALLTSGDEDPSHLADLTNRHVLAPPSCVQFAGQHQLCLCDHDMFLRAVDPAMIYAA